MKNKIITENKDVYPEVIPPEIQRLIAREAEDGPIARQFVTSAAERIVSPEELSDPIGDDRHSPVTGLVHRYPDRVLLKVTHRCAVYCRFCFRRDMVGPDAQVLSDEQLKKAFSYIRNTPDIWEVILTGGDPFVLSPKKVSKILIALETIDHIKTIRIHTRVPIVTPKKIDDRMIEALQVSKPVWVSIHCNHVDELTSYAVAALERMTEAGIPLVSQSVLLKGVNDDIVTLERLFRKLVEHKVKPYYLHHCDMAPGTGHFRTTLEDGVALMAELRKRLSGLALPTYMFEIPGGQGKYPIPG